MYLQDFRLDVSRDPNVHIFSGSLTRGLAWALILPLILFLLVVPVVVCNVLDSLALRIMTILIFISIFLVTLSGLTKARTTEIFVAGAT